MSLDADNLELAKEYANGSDNIDVNQLGQLLEGCNIKLAGFQLRDLIKEMDTDKNGTLNIDEYINMMTVLINERNYGITFKSAIKQVENIKKMGGTTYASSEGTTHSIATHEINGFAEWLNIILGNDESIKYEKFPIKQNTEDLFVVIKDGIILCKLINIAQKGTIDVRAINFNKLNVYKIHENMTLAINSAAAIGVSTVNIGAEDIISGVQHICLGLIWQIIKIGLFANINIQDHPGLVLLLRDGETIQDLNRLSTEELLLRWVNYQLELANQPLRINNFTNDIKNSEAYTHVIKEIAPAHFGVSSNHLQDSNLTNRAEGMLKQADKIGAKQFISAASIVNPIQKLNLAFIANLFNTYPNLNVDEEQSIIVETREAKSYRNWINSLGVKPYVSYLTSDLYDGLIIFQLFDIIKKGIVDWNRVKKKFHKLRALMERVENCNYAVEIGKKLKFSLVGIQGKDLYDGIETLVLAFVWQLMKAYTLSILSEIATTGIDMKNMDQAILAWANEKLSESGSNKTVKSFGSSDLKDSLVMFDLIQAIVPNSIDKSYVLQSPSSEEQLMENASYAISSARKIGAKVYALPEDVVESKGKMMMTIFACLMIRDRQN
ncbi:Plastin-1 [Intoshia linei]|uniref:Plastin-1 n=1 Tax=Intoshia linei TaxID=1819745 RepID=A0A177B4U4_9BILA|nr:Plastin-1 [Intoshia linei]